MNQSKEKLEIAQPFDGMQPEISVEEKQAAAEKFQGACEDTMLAHMASVRRSESIKGKPEASLLMRLDAEDGSRLTISVRSSSIEDADYNLPFSVSLQEIDPNGYGRKYVRYELSRDLSTVTRHDIPDGYEKAQAARFDEDVDFNNPLLAIRGIESQIGRIKEEMQNIELAKTMKLNDQPVGLEEIAAVVELVSQAEPYDPLR